MQDVVIIDAVRTPIGKYKGALKDVRPDDLAAITIEGLIKRNPGLPIGMIEDVVFGCANQAGEDNRNVARMALLLAGLPVEVPGVTVNRLCGSGLDAISCAARAIRAEEGDIFIAGGTESMTRAPLVMAKPDSPFPRGNMALYDTTIGWRFINQRLQEKYGTDSMPETAENVAKELNITREEQDAFAFGSQKKAAKAIAEGKFQDEIIPIHTKTGKGEEIHFYQDEHPRPDTTLEKLSALKPLFPGGTVTAGNSSGINDGASALLLMSSKKAEELGMKPMARLVASAVSGVEPRVMGLGPIEATRKVCKRAGISLADIDLVELNEAFAAQSIACIRALDLDPQKVNPNGGAIALGHPLGASGARIMTTLLHELKRQKKRYGLATMCVGVGQGIAVIVENFHR